MNFHEFLDLCKKYKNNFFFDGAEIRAKVKNDLYCPLTYVCLKEKGVSLPTGQFTKAVSHLGIEFHTGVVISIIADYDSIELDTAYVMMRTQMLEACGLVEGSKNGTTCKA